MSWQTWVFDLFSGAVTALLGYAVWLLKRQRKDRSANSRGTMLLLRARITDYHDRYCRAGVIPPYEYSFFMEMVDAYYELGGDGMVKKMAEDVKQLDFGKETKQ